MPMLTDWISRAIYNRFFTQVNSQAIAILIDQVRQLIKDAPLLTCR
ncbi:hypothetical protein [Nostoc sp. UHCC 0251]|nr:hypothetical protein [Nostoc sp. UHCC 0251]MEA5622207.1 hypothetical protein [Nostoc sp. UHCC 0251]